MSTNTKAIKARITSVKNTKKITKAMEMVAATKMRKAVEATLASRMYAVVARDMMEHLAEVPGVSIPLLEKRSVSRILMILVTSNRGLCGSFNSNVFKQALLVLSDQKNLARHRIEHRDVSSSETITIDMLGIGKKSALFARRYGYKLIGVFDGLKEKPTFEEVLPIITMAMDAFIKKYYDKVVVVYTDFKSSMQQIPKVRQLLPISAIDLEKMIHSLGVTPPLAVDTKGRVRDEYLFEPGKRLIMESILPRLVEIQLYQAILESSASEYSARMVAMKNASESAGDMIADLSLEYNKGRQTAITREIAEIAGGAVAVGQ